MYLFSYSVTRDIDFPQLYSEKVRIKHIVAFNEELTMKIHVIHRLQFYREYMLDFKLEGYLENILVTVLLGLLRQNRSSVKTLCSISSRARP